jgi:NAD(P) transhydrogenase subunit alpha
VESLGAKFVELELANDDAEGKGGYAKAMDEEFYLRQRALMASVVAESDIVVTTAAIPGRPSPLLITREAVEGMPAGGVIIDLAAERGGNCELSQPDQRIEHTGITILGPTNLPSEIPTHASQMVSNNTTKFLLNMVKDGQLVVDLEDEIVRETLVTQGGEVVHERLRSMLNLPPIEIETVHAETLEPAPPGIDASGGEAEAIESSGKPNLPSTSQEAASEDDDRLNVGDLTATAGEHDVVAEDAEAEDDDDAGRETNKPND